MPAPTLLAAGLFLSLFTSTAQAASQEASARGVPGTIREKGVLRVADLRFDNFLGIVSANLEVRAGDEAGMKFMVEGFARDERKDDAGRPEYRVQIKYSIDIKDPQNRSLQPESTGVKQTILSMQDDDWRPSIEWSVQVPPTAPSGRYPILIRLWDEVGGQSTEHTAILNVAGPAIRATGQFEIVAIEFAPSDRGPWRPIWYFESRAPVHIRYKIVGYGVGAEQQVSVEEDWAVLNSKGEEVLGESSATVEESKAFYPPRFIERYFSVSLRDPSPGDYKIRIDARDIVGDRSATAEARFVLRP